MDTEQIKELIQSNTNYWEKRALQNKLNIIENELDYSKRLDSIYKEANKQIDDKLAALYQRYADNNKLTLSQAYKKLPKETEKDYKNDVNKYISEAREYNGDPQWKQYLLNQSLMHQHSVLDQLRTEYREVVYNIDKENTGGKFLEKIYKNANYYAQYTNNETKNAFALVDEDKITRLLKENWTGAGNFSQLIWKNKEQLVQALDDIVIKGLAVGNSYSEMSKELAKRMETSTKNAKRLIMTEAARMDNEGLLDYYKRIEVEQLVFVATLDMKTSEICRAMDGTIINVEDAQIGLNVPPLHPYCRSVISPHYDFNKVDERIYRDESGRNKKGGNRTYAEYLQEELGDVKAAQALVSTRNGLSELVKAVSISQLGDLSIPRNNIKNAKEQEINRDDKNVIRNYTNWGYKNLNEDLRNDVVMDDATKEMMQLLDNALEKLPYYQGGMVTRDLTFGKDDLLAFIDTFKQGNIIQFKEYLSASRDKYRFNQYADVTLIINSKTGRSIEDYSSMKAEREVLFTRNSLFQVINIKVEHPDSYNGEPYYIIELDEVVK